MAIGYEQWHAGIGCDLDALKDAGPAERAAIEGLLVACGVRGWRDVEALAALDTPHARALLEDALAAGNQEIRMAVYRRTPRILFPATRIALLVDALEHATFHGGLCTPTSARALDHTAARTSAIPRVDTTGSPRFLRNPLCAYPARRPRRS